MKIYHFEFAKTGLNLSGGEVCLIEIAKFLIAKKIKNIILTTDNGKRTYEEQGLVEGDFLEYRIIDSFIDEQKNHLFISYIKRTRQALVLINMLKFADDDVLFCHSEYFPNFIPFYIAAKSNHKTQLFYWVHTIAPGIFRGYKGQFTKKLYFPRVNLIHNKLNQVFYRYSAFARGKVVSVNSYYEKSLSVFYPNNQIYIIKKFGGAKIDIQKFCKRYDMAWMGRFQDLKNIDGALLILKRLKAKNPHVKMLVMGDGQGGKKKKFLNKCEMYGLKENVDYKGFISGNEKYAYLQQSKIFLVTSLYESYGLVNLEAMACGLPVIAFDLPVFRVFEKGMIHVPILDYEKFSDEIEKIIYNEKNYLKKRQEAIDFSKEFSWSYTGQEILNLINR